MALNAAMSVAARSLEVFQTGIEVAGHNIANANTPGYVREELNITTGPTYEQGRLLKGTGADLRGIQLAIDHHLETRIHDANTDLAYAEVRQEAWLGLEAAIAELGTGDISTRTNEFLSALNEYANEPTLAGLRELVISEGRSLADSINYTREQVDRLREVHNLEIETTVKEANKLLERIQELNIQIVKLEGGGVIPSEATNLRSERLEALDRLSEIVDIQIEHRPTGRVDVRTQNEYLIIEATTQGFETFVPDEEDGTVFGVGVRFSETKSDRIAGNGELNGLLTARTDILGGFTDDLDAFASAFIFEFNKIHSGGSGETGFTSIVSEHRVDDSTVALNDVATNGLDFTASHGSFNVVLVDTVTGSETTTNIAVDLDGLGGNDTSLDDLATSLDAVAQLNASVDANGALRLTTDAGYELKFAGDTSGVLAALGINTFYSGTDAETIKINDTVLNDASKFAGSQGGGPGDASNALELIQFFEQPLDELDGHSFDDAYQSLVYEVSQGSANEQSVFEGFQTFHDSLMSQREQHSGVSIDEETVNILQFQHSYQAAARVLSTLNELLQIVINL